MGISHFPPLLFGGGAIRDPVVNVVVGVVVVVAMDANQY